jgi:Arm domain-containing DNA-binding protein
MRRQGGRRSRRHRIRLRTACTRWLTALFNDPEISDLAERGGFEPPVQVYPAQQISNRFPASFQLVPAWFRMVHRARFRPVLTPYSATFLLPQVSRLCQHSSGLACHQRVISRQTDSYRKPWMPKQHLTDKSAATLPVRGQQTEYHDTVLRGLLLRVTAGGARSYGLRYRFAGQPRRLHIGEVGVLSLADARQQARGLLADVTKGRIPLPRARPNARRPRKLGERRTGRSGGSRSCGCRPGNRGSGVRGPASSSSASRGE